MDNTNKFTSSSNNNFLELEKSTSHIIVEIVEYVPNAVLSKTIIKKSTGNITAMSFYEGEELSEKISPFDTYVQIIHGKAQVNINKKEHHLELGAGLSLNQVTKDYSSKWGEADWKLLPNVVLGYRYHPYSGGVIFRTGIGFTYAFGQFFHVSLGCTL